MLTTAVLSWSRLAKVLLLLLETLSAHPFQHLSKHEGPWVGPSSPRAGGRGTP